MPQINNNKIKAHFSAKKRLSYFNKFGNYLTKSFYCYSLFMWLLATYLFKLINPTLTPHTLKFLCFYFSPSLLRRELEGGGMAKR